MSVCINHYIESGYKLRDVEEGRLWWKEKEKGAGEHLQRIEKASNL